MNQINKKHMEQPLIASYNNKSIPASIFIAKWM